MKSLRRRLIFHFSAQFVTMAIALSILVFILLLLLVQHLANEESKRNFPVGLLENIWTETEVKDNKAGINDSWEKVLAEKDMWLQVVSEKGKIIGESNTPTNLPDQYSLPDLLKMDETKQIHDYTVYTAIEASYEKPYIFILGFHDRQLHTLKKLVRDYEKNGKFEEHARTAIHKELKAVNASLQIVDPAGKVIQSAGEFKGDKNFLPLDLLIRKEVPGQFATSTSFLRIPDTGLTWVVQTPKKKGQYANSTLLEEILIAFIIVGIAILVITLIISFWNGFRYGQPLFIFTSWLERMALGRYDEVLTEKERKKIFRKNGKVRVRYRLYKEVINAFYEMAEKLDHSVKERATLERTREEWMAGISHDLRTPLATIQGYGHLLESGQYKWSTSELEDMGKTIREKGEYILRLIEDFSLTFRLKNKELTLSIEEVDIQSFLQNITNKFSSDITLKAYSFAHSDTKTIGVIAADPKWFERMMDNLIFNAVKHNPPGTAVTIKSLPRNNGSRISIIIEDNGNGMDKQTISKLFNRYYRGTNTDERTEGSGLGMSIAKEIAELHGGKITVDSEAGAGTRVIITLPCLL